ncbi:MAG: DUF423 domain-containing protein [Caulobacteraceae bacterium]|nr:DUF423 domain-containing protein [Caulobacter sp.]
MSRALRLWLALAALDGFMAVAAGAFGAHGVSDPYVRDLLRTGAQYQGAHAAAAFAVAAALRDRTATVAAALFAVGGLLFGGSLDLLALSGARLWGAVTPVGGLGFLAGWALAGWSVLRGAPRS